MLKAGRWLPTPHAERLKWEGKDIPCEHARRSYHLNSLYPEWLRFFTFAEKFILSKHDPEAWQSFVNQWLAEPFLNMGNVDEMKVALDATPIKVLPEKIPAGYRPLMAVDVSKNCFWFRARSFNEKRESLGLDYGMLPTFEDIEAVRRKYGIPFVFVDMGYTDRLQEVLEWCAQHSGVYIPIEGIGTMYAPVRITKTVIGGGVFKGHSLMCVKARTFDWKEILTKRIKRDNITWANEPTIGDDYKQQMLNEPRVEKTGPSGNIKVEYVRRGDQHYWDCEVYLLAAFDVVRPMLFNVVETDAQPPTLQAVEPEPAEAKPAAAPYRGETGPDQVWS
jgi:hypothetical protein